MLKSHKSLNYKKQTKKEESLSSMQNSEDTLILLILQAYFKIGFMRL